MGLIKRAFMMLLGVGVTLGYWSLRGPGADTTERLADVPAVVWEGGTAVNIAASCNQPGKLHLSFGRRPLDAKEDHPSDQSLEVEVPLEVGDHNYKVEVPAGVHGYVELGISQPTVGAIASVRVQVAEHVAEDAAQLTAPLEQGTAFFAQLHMNDYASATND